MAKENSLLQVGTFSGNRGLGGERAYPELQPGREQQDETGRGLHKEAGHTSSETQRRFCSLSFKYMQ